MATVRHTNGTVVRTGSCSVVSSVTVREAPGGTPATLAEPEPEEVSASDVSGVWDICAAANYIYPLELLEENGVLSGHGLCGNFGRGETIREVRDDDDETTRKHRFTLEGMRTGSALVFRQVLSSGRVRNTRTEPLVLARRSPWDGKARGSWEISAGNRVAGERAPAWGRALFSGVWFLELDWVRAVTLNLIPPRQPPPHANPSAATAR